MKQNQHTKLVDLEKNTVEFIQDKLIKLSLLSPPVDGIAGPNTHRAWATFKKDIKAIALDSICVDEVVVLLQSAYKVSSDVGLTLITKEQLGQIFAAEVTDKQVKDLNDCLIKNDITTKNRILHFLSQTGHESGGLKWLTELSSGEQYENRKDLGNIYPGDGPKYKGSGVLQITGRYNYQCFADYIDDQDVMLGCAYVAKHYPFSSAGWYWTSRNLNNVCDSGASISKVTKIINGGQRGLVDRTNYYNRAKEVLGQRKSFLLQ